MSEHRTASFQLLVNIQSYSDQELKGLAEDLQGQERDISKQRRLIHAKLDILRAVMVRRLRDKYGSGETLFEGGDVDKLSAILAGGKASTNKESEASEKDCLLYTSDAA